jgi:hypothetical protein
MYMQDFSQPLMGLMDSVSVGVPFTRTQVSLAIVCHVLDAPEYQRQSVRLPAPMVGLPDRPLSPNARHALALMLLVDRHQVAIEYCGRAHLQREFHAWIKRHPLRTTFPASPFAVWSALGNGLFRAGVTRRELLEAYGEWDVDSQLALSDDPLNAAKDMAKRIHSLYMEAESIAQRMPAPAHTK